MSNITQQKVPEGYKQTEVGIIPQNWNVGSLNQLTLDMLQGVNTAIDIPEYVEDGIPMLKANNVIDQVVKFHGCDCISRRTYDGYGDRFKLRRNDFLFSNIGARLGTGSLLEDDIECSFAWNIMRIVPNQKKVFPRFLAFQINSPKNSEKIKSEQSGSGMGFIPKTTMLKVQLPLPENLEEQTAIANTLSDVDALITSLEKLIAKMRAIKTAAMQQLLTGKKRLPPFDQTPDGKKRGYKQTELGEIPEDWEIVSLGDIALIDPENLGASTDSDYEFDYISLEQIDRGALIGTTKIKYGSAPSRARRVIRKGDILVSTVRPNLMSHYMQKEERKDLICSTGFSVLRPKINTSDSNLLFFHLFAGVVNRQIEMLISGSNYPAINSGDVKGLKISLPSFEEQVEIASVLSEMDNEIVALDKRLNKTKQIKQGMMQELLTGRTRLV